MSNINVPIVWVLGGPGSGKRTQCAKIAEKYSFTHLSIGELLRAEVASGSNKGRELEKIIASGNLLPNETVLCLLEVAIRLKLGDTSGFLVDGFPREREQGAIFERRIAPADMLLFLNCKSQTLMSRAAASSSRRMDDSQKTIVKRINTFLKAASGILTQYLPKTLFLDGERAPEVIFQDICCAMDCLIKRKNYPPICQ